MSIDFVSPSMRAAGSDLTIAISPLGLVELSDEEFEVHGPRLNRYAQGWAFYLGHHWAYRREAGEPQITFNYVQALSDWLTNFTFSKGITFQSPKQFQHTIPALLQRIWTKDNNKQQIIWEIGNQGSVQGDAFIKVAYEPPFTDAVNKPHGGRVRILPINASFCFPEWHPHDRERLIRFKIKYRFWGTAPEGTRQVFTYVEIITDDYIEEYVNDELIDRRPNPLGTIPIVHIANRIASASPWGLSDIMNVIPLNREYNEKATDVSDIINYHTAPVTVVTGAKASNLEMGAKKIWALTSKDARVENLTGGAEGLPAALEYLHLIKIAMHEMIGIPESSLGVAQPISNTSGVALSIQYMPTMMVYDEKRTQYEVGFKQICKLALQTLFNFEPEALVYNPQTEGIKEEPDQPMVLDPNDPEIYDVGVNWPPPLPVDQTILLSEIQVKKSLGLESTVGALKELGEEFPDEKLAELFAERLADTEQEGALQLRRAIIAAVIQKYTGLVPEGFAEEEPPPAPNAEGAMPPAPPATPIDSMPLPPLPSIGGILGGDGSDFINNVVTASFGTKLPQRRNLTNDS